MIDGEREEDEEEEVGVCMVDEGLRRGREGLLEISSRWVMYLWRGNDGGGIGR